MTKQLTKLVSDVAVLTITEKTGKPNGKLTAWIEYEMRSLSELLTGHDIRTGRDITTGTIEGDAFIHVMNQELAAIDSKTNADSALVEAVWDMVI